jgi:thioredoxin reductase
MSSTATAARRRRTHPSKQWFTVTCASGRKLVGRKLLFASGTCDTLPDLPGIKECYGATVHHCPYCDGWEHRDKRLLAYGDTAEAAIGLALSLRTWSDRVVALSNGHEADEKQEAVLRRNELEMKPGKISRLLHRDQQLLGVEFAAAGVLEAEALFFNTGQEARCALARQLGCELDEECRARTTGKQQTNVPGVFLAGDADGDVQFAIVAAAEGATAAVAMNRELQEEYQAQEANTKSDKTTLKYG